MRTTTNLDQIEDLTRAYARERATLADRIGDLEAELTAIKRRRLRGIRNALDRAVDARDALSGAIAAAPALFEKPRTVTIDGIRVGIMKSKGKIAWDDDDKVCQLIDRHFPASADTLTRVTRKPVAAALKELNVAELKRIGCRVEETGDQVVIKPQDGELDKLVGRLLAEASSIEDFTLPEA